jgi:hypothetical protein
MVLYAASLLELFEATGRTAERVTAVLEYAVGAVVVASTVEKAVLIRRAFRAARRERTASPADGGGSAPG